MLESKENLQNNNNQSKNDKFTSSFIMIMMVFFIFGSVFRNFYSDAPLFKIGWTKYSMADCKKYIAYVKDSSDLSKEMKFQKNIYEVIKIAQQKAAITSFCKKLGLKISNYDVKKSIQNDSRFLDGNMFSRNKFLDFLKSSMLSENEYYDLKKEELLHLQFWFFIKNSYSLNEQFIKEFDKAYFSYRYIKYSIVNHKDVVLNYYEKDLLDFYEKNKEKFKTYKQYTYEGFKIETKFFSQEDLNFLDRVIKNNNFQSIIKNYPQYTTKVSHDQLVYLFKGGLNYHSDKINAEKGNCFYFASDGTFAYVVKVVDIKPAKQLSFYEVKDVVRKIYELEKKPFCVNKKNIKWKKTKLNAANFYQGDLPYRVSKRIFSFPLNSVQEIHENGVSYFIIVEKILSVDTDKKTGDLKDFVDNELFKSISKYLLSFVESVK
ncbi:peptidylprolyl isomerase [Alphaproteobacteria bacterium endosymbiont of Tiliacea citrago]|uniref:peptidylprolyl isomerase n=1 Tax=Alphaproteobacteria bacterium endosymbiont of Tiliacea citrago TaxID=3077944 RepID=UPI00313DF2E4